MPRETIDCWNCGASLNLKSRESIKKATACPDCGEFLNEDHHNDHANTRSQSSNRFDTEEELTDSVFSIHAERAAKRRGRRSNYPGARSGKVLAFCVTSALPLL